MTPISILLSIIETAFSENKLVHRENRVSLMARKVGILG